MSAADELWMKYVEARRLPVTEETETCDTHYPNLGTTCPNLATHKLVYRVRGPDDYKQAGELIQLHKCDDCGNPEEVPD